MEQLQETSSLLASAWNATDAYPAAATTLQVLFSSSRGLTTTHSNHLSVATVSASNIVALLLINLTFDTCNSIHSTMEEYLLFFLTKNLIWRCCISLFCLKICTFACYKNVVFFFKDFDKARFNVENHVLPLLSLCMDSLNCVQSFRCSFNKVQGHLFSDSAMTFLLA